MHANARENIRCSQTLFGGNQTLLHELAAAIRLNVSDVGSTSPSVLADADDEVSEGRILFRLHQSRERNATIIRKRKDRALNDNGCLRCDVCGFDFQTVYGDLGEGFIECHHTLPVSQLVPGQTTKIKDLALLCANCHRMMHRSKTVKTVEELKAVLLN